MSKLSRLREIAQAHGDSALKLGKQLSIGDIEGQELHIVRVDFSKAIVKDERGNNVVDAETGAVVEKSYPVVQFAEYPDSYYAGGDALNQTVSAWRDEYNGDIAALNADLESEGGIKVAFKKESKKNGRSYVCMYVLYN